MSMRVSTVVLAGMIAYGGICIAAAQDTAPPQPPRTVVWEDTVATADIGGHQLQAVPDGNGGLYLVAATVSRRDSKGRILWTARDVARGDRRAVEVAADGGVWLAIVDGWQDVKRLTALKFASQDGRILRRHQWSVPLSADDSTFRFMPDDTGAMVVVAKTSGIWRLSVLKPGDDKHAQPFAWPGGAFHPIDLSPKADGRMTLLMFDESAHAYWFYTISDGARRIAGRSVPQPTCYPAVRLLADDHLTYVDCDGLVKKYDPATDRTMTVGRAPPDEGTGALQLVQITGDGAYVMKGMWTQRGAPPPAYDKRMMVLSVDGRKAWHMTLDQDDLLVDSRSVLRVTGECEPRDICPTLQMQLVAYAP